jgi:AAA ATPase domain
MDRRDNPYTPGAGRRPEKLAGRDADLRDFAVLVNRLADGRYERSMVFSGLRGVGKTVLLLEFDVIAREAGWISSDVREVDPGSDFRLAFARLATKALRSMSFKRRAETRIKRALGIVRSFSAVGPGGMGVKIEVDAVPGVADSGELGEDLTELLVEIGETARANATGVLFLIDEMQNLGTPALSAICMAFHSLSQKGLPVALAGAGLPTLPGLMRSAKPYAPRLFEYRDIGRLSEAEARTALVGPAQRRDVKFQPGAVRAVIERSGGYPYFIQEYGRVLWNEIDESPITEAAVLELDDVVQDNLDSKFFAPQFELASETEQRYLLALAALGDGPHRSAAAATAAGYRDTPRASHVRDSLLDKELLWSPRRGYVDFTVPYFAEYLQGLHAEY